MTSTAIHEIPCLPTAAWPADVPDLIEATGTTAFGPTLVRYLNRLCGADHCAVFKFGQGSLEEVTASSFDPLHGAGAQLRLYLQQQLWRKDPAIHEARQAVLEPASRVIHMDLRAIGYSDLRPTVFPHVRDRVLVCGRRNDMALGLSIVRSDPHCEFAPSAVAHLGEVAGLLVSLLAKHAEIVARRPNPALALASLEEIEGCVHEMAELPRREGEVCSRILYGMSTTGIALDLAVGEESVKTYRKRAYQRLRIGSERELLGWYLALWSEWRCHFSAAACRRALPQVVHH